MGGMLGRTNDPGHLADVDELIFWFEVWLELLKTFTKVCFWDSKIQIRARYPGYTGETLHRLELSTLSKATLGA